MPLWADERRAPHLPIGVQLIAAPWREDLCLRVAAALQARGRVQRAAGQGTVMNGDDLNRPGPLAEVTAAFARYEDALVNNRLEVLDELFWDSPHTVRYGVAENLYGYRRDPRLPRGSPAAGPGAQRCTRTVITTYGRDFATANDRVPARRQPQARPPEPDLVRIADGWHVVAAHVSLIDPPRP